MLNMHRQRLFAMLIFSLCTLYAYASDFTHQITYYHSTQCNTVSASFCLTDDRYPDGSRHEEYIGIEKNLITQKYSAWTWGLLDGEPIVVEGSKEITEKLKGALDKHINENTLNIFQPIDKLAHNLAYSHDTGK